MFVFRLVTELCCFILWFRSISAIIYDKIVGTLHRDLVMDLLRLYLFTETIPQPFCAHILLKEIKLTY